MGLDFRRRAQLKWAVATVAGLLLGILSLSARKVVLGARGSAHSEPARPRQSSKVDPGQKKKPIKKALESGRRGLSSSRQKRSTSKSETSFDPTAVPQSSVDATSKFAVKPALDAKIKLAAELGPKSDRKPVPKTSPTPSSPAEPRTAGEQKPSSTSPVKDGSSKWDDRALWIIVELDAKPVVRTFPRDLKFNRECLGRLSANELSGRLSLTFSLHTSSELGEIRIYEYPRDGSGKDVDISVEFLRCAKWRRSDGQGYDRKVKLNIDFRPDLR